ncbi:MAG TPA: alginate lyase family protein [Pyrinomonadaceae bacterium]|jgi:hypothetical protein
MNKTLEKLKKLRGRTTDELRVRGAQLLAARAERYGLSAQARPLTDEALFNSLDEGRASSPVRNADALLEHFRTHSATRFFASFRNREETVAELHRRFDPEAEDALIERARRICEGSFSLLGFDDLRFGTPPDFHLEPVSGKTSPRVHWSRVEELSADLTGDKKIVWELNRCQYFTTLGRAYWYTGDETYAETFAAHLDAWMEQNSAKRGVNWVSSLEVALRAISWLWALHFFKDSEHVRAPLFLRALKYLSLHARHLETYLSTYSSPNTHLTGEALGLFYLGTLLPEFRAARGWRALGERILFEALPVHVRRDGVYFEQTSYYHRYTTDFYTHLYILARRVGEECTPPLLEEKLVALLDHLMYITRPDGTTPFFGDDDGGRLVMLDERAANDFRATLSTGAALFSRADYKYVAGGEASEETLWLLGPRALLEFDRLDAEPPRETSVAFSDGGYYVMRDAWTRDANYLLIDCGPHGTLNCGHAHADALSFELAARGRTLLVDPGTYTYTGASDVRDAFRSSAAHNTLMIDDESSSVPAGPFSWQTVADASCRAWLCRPRFDYFEGTHDGYDRLSPPASHARSILFVRGDYWVMRDRVATAGRHRYDLRFHFAVDAAPTIEAAVRESTSEGAGLELAVFGAGGAWRKEEGWVSPCYGARSRAPVCVFSAEAEGAQEFVSLLIPLGAREDLAEVREIEAVGGRAFEIRRGHERDLCLIRSAGQVEAEGVTSDFAWTWLRLEHATGRLKEFIVLDGQRLETNGEQLFVSPERTLSAVARYAGDEVRLDVEGTKRFSVARCGRKCALVNGEAFAADDATPSFEFGREHRAASRGETAETLI